MKVLFIAEAVTLAHVGRGLALSDALHRRGVEVELALAGTTEVWRTAFPQHTLPGIGAKPFAEALRAGKPVLTREVLRQSIASDRLLLQAVRPDLVIGDFRLSLSVSARLEGVPYATLSNAYWSEACLLPMPMPVLPLSRALPLTLAQWLFDLGKRFVLPQHVAPMNAVRAEFGLSSLGPDLRRVYTDADQVLFADLPNMFPSAPTPLNHHYLGAILWSPLAPRPPWLDEWIAGATAAGRHSVYVSVGSSGDPQALRLLVEILLAMDLAVIAATAGSQALAGLQHEWLRRAPYLPGDEVAKMVTLVLCNGGSMGCQQAFVAGRAVLGVCGNMDQFLNMAGVEGLGAGLALRADRLSVSTVQPAMRRLLSEPGFAVASAAAGDRIRALDAGATLHALLPKLTQR